MQFCVITFNVQIHANNSIHNHPGAVGLLDTQDLLYQRCANACGEQNMGGTIPAVAKHVLHYLDNLHGTGLPSWHVADKICPVVSADTAPDI